MTTAHTLLATPYTLRPMSADDLHTYRAIFADADVMKAVGQPLGAEAAARAARLSLVAQHLPDGRFRHWIIARDGEDAGLLGLALQTAHWVGGSAELGVLLWPKWQGRGAATAAIRAAEAWAFEVAKLSELTTHHAKGHEPAAALMRACGFSEVPGGAHAPLPRAWHRKAPMI